MLNEFLFKRPEWFKHEGYWRLAQVFRIGPVVFGMVMAIAAAFLAIFEFGWDYFRYVYVWVGGSIAYIISSHLLMRLIVWIVEGFKSSKSPTL